jgi:hypothetical protein
MPWLPRAWAEGPREAGKSCRHARGDLFRAFLMSSLQMQAMQAGEISSHACEIPGPKGIVRQTVFPVGRVTCAVYSDSSGKCFKKNSGIAYIS